MANNGIPSERAFCLEIQRTTNINNGTTICMSKKPQHSNNTFISCYLPFLAKAFSFFLSRLPPARWIGPWAKEYTSSITWSLTTRLPLPLDGRIFAHCEEGFVALHTITWQCTNTNGWALKPLSTRWRPRVILHGDVIRKSKKKSYALIGFQSLLHEVSVTYILFS